MKKVIIVLIVSFAFVATLSAQNDDLGGVWTLSTRNVGSFIPQFLILRQFDNYWFVVLVDLEWDSYSVAIGATSDSGVIYHVSPTGGLNSIQQSMNDGEIEITQISGPGEFPGNTYREATREDILRLEEYGIRIPEDGQK